MAKAKTKKAPERLTPIPKHAPRARRSPADKAPGAQPAQAPDLSHIAEQLRPLAVPITELQFDPANAMTHPEGNLDAIRGSLAAYGQRKPIVVNRRTGHVEAGNGTLAAALSLNWTHLAVVYVDDDPATAAGFAIADNRTAQLAEFDSEALDKLLRDVNTKGDERLDAMMADLAKEQGLYLTGDSDGKAGNDAPDPGAQVDRAKELQEKWGTASGQLWVIPSKSVPGKEHRLLCGDSTVAEDVERVMGGDKATAVVTDPPYGIGWKRGVNNARNSKAHEGIENDEDTTARDQALSLVAGIPAAVFGSFYAPFPVDVLQVLVWHKPPDSGLVGSVTGFRRDAEPVFLVGPWPKRTVCWGSVLHSSEGQAGTVTKTGHPHTKPVPVIVSLLEACPPGPVLDLFLGSGSTMVAAEQAGRLCYGIELSPGYVAVALERLHGMGLEPRTKAD